jgi:hypothetical protein
MLAPDDSPSAQTPALRAGPRRQFARSPPPSGRHLPSEAPAPFAHAQRCSKSGSERRQRLPSTTQGPHRRNRRCCRAFWCGNVEKHLRLRAAAGRSSANSCAVLYHIPTPRATQRYGGLLGLRPAPPSLTASEATAVTGPPRHANRQQQLQVMQRRATRPATRTASPRRATRRHRHSTHASGQKKPPANAPRTEEITALLSAVRLWPGRYNLQGVGRAVLCGLTCPG